jgi:CAAX prenyl protease-like protein
VTDTLQALIFYGFVALLILLRFDAKRFGAADYDDEDANDWRSWLRRLSWYGFALALIAVIYVMAPWPLSVLRLQAGPSLIETIVVGLALGSIGAFMAVFYAWVRYRDFRLPAGSRYPAGLVTVIGTAFVDEAAFRGILLGLLLWWGWPNALAIGLQAVLYVIAMGIARRQRPIGITAIFVVMALLAGGVTIATGGIGAAFLGAALTRLALFLVTGHAGQMRDVDTVEDEALDAADLTPEGWEIVPDHDQTGGYWR